MRSVRRKYSKPRKTVQPLGLEHLRLLNQHLLESDPAVNLTLWRTVWRMNILYSTLCRFSEINVLTTKHLQLQTSPTEHFDIYIAKCKTDQFGSGKTISVYPVVNDSLVCPVKLTKDYLKRLALYSPNQPYEGNLQPRVHLNSETQKQQPLPNQKICYSTCLEESKALLAQLGIKGRFEEHSGRRGGATAAACNRASMTEIQLLGQWKSSVSASKYIDQTSAQKTKMFQLLYPNETKNT
jgi:hypothetical protein